MMKLLGGNGFTTIDVDSENLHCMAANLAVALHYYGLANLRGCFGSTWHFDFSEATGRIELSPDGIEKDIERETGYALRPFTGEDLERDLTASIAAGRPSLVCADAFLMPWVPYYSHMHTPHWFLVEGIDTATGLLQIVDASRVSTRWGEARPTRAIYPLSSAAAAIAAMEDRDAALVCDLRRVSAGRPAAPADQVAANCERILRTVGAERAIVRFSDWFRDRVGVREEIDRFGHLCWLSARARRLHLLWLQEVAAAPHAGILAFTQAARAWQRASAFAYVASRRMEQDGSPRQIAFDVLREEVSHAELRSADALLADA
jgi:Butirosin biosynthesis protein H, N-terminal